MDSRDRWAGWAAAGALLLITVGAFRAITGFIGIFKDEWVVRGFNAYYFIDVSGLAWWMLIMGLLLIFAGLAVLAGQTWGRVVGHDLGTDVASRLSDLVDRDVGHVRAHLLRADCGEPTQAAVAKPARSAGLARRPRSTLYTVDRRPWCRPQRWR
jgi:hypothetical protein